MGGRGSWTDKLSRALDAEMAVADKLFRTLQERTGNSSGKGVERDSYGKGEQIAHDLCADAARGLDLEISTDLAGNLYMTLPGEDRAAPAWYTGSHLDSVPSGGNYDGAAGVVAGLAALAAFRRAGTRLPRDVTVVGTRAEEVGSWYAGRHSGHVGSRAALGMFSEDELDSAVRQDTGLSMRRQMELSGLDPKALFANPPHIKPERLRGWVELHIEQGPVLEREGYPVGIVTGIRGTLRAREAACFGGYTHSGAVPREYRQDAVIAVADFIHAMDQAWEHRLAQGSDMVFTVGKLSTDVRVHALSKVPGEVRFCIDIRSQDEAVLDEMAALIERQARTIGEKRRVRFEIGAVSRQHPAAMDASFRTALTEGARSLGISAMDIPSGAGHDAAEFAHAGVPAAMIFVRNANGSHNPDEAMSMDDFALATRLLAWFFTTH